MAEPIEMPFRLWTRVGRGKHVLHGVRWHNLTNTIEPPVCGDDATLCQITLTTCYYDDILATKFVSLVAYQKRKLSLRA